MSERARGPTDSPPNPSKTPPQAGAGVRPLLDAMVQSCTVELFHSLGVAVAPLPSKVTNPQQATYFADAGVVSFASPKATGSLSLSWSEGVFTLFTPPVVSRHGCRDLLRELTNQLIGRIKNRLLQFQVVFRIGVPTVISGPALERQRQRREMEVVYLFRTLRGEIVVILDATFAQGALSYSGGVQVAKEGDFILF
ncbi:MAG TPA: hypothetical protein VER33_07140 [Polyangiaceae bacterium]|nr:hypothetical protein [Polyangiaceae bacterium]